MSRSGCSAARSSEAEERAGRGDPPFAEQQPAERQEHGEHEQPAKGGQEGEGRRARQ